VDEEDKKFMSLSQLEKDFRDSYLDRIFSLSTGKNKPQESTIRTQKSFRMSGDKFNFFVSYVFVDCLYIIMY
jgi:hypothetical protein